MLVLASASPRRADLLRGLGLPFEIVPSDATEPTPTSEDGRDPAAFVERLAQLKGTPVARSHPRSLVVAADTVVVLDETVLVKPRDEREAAAMLKALRGRTHRVFTGVCVLRGDELRVGHEVTSVTFGDFSDDFVAAYVRTGEPMDKAGAYAAQGKGTLLIARIEGDYFNVVGLPVRKTIALCSELGLDIRGAWDTSAADLETE